MKRICLSQLTLLFEHSISPTVTSYTICMHTTPYVGIEPRSPSRPSAASSSTATCEANRLHPASRDKQDFYLTLDKRSGTDSLTSTETPQIGREDGCRHSSNPPRSRRNSCWQRYHLENRGCMNTSLDLNHTVTDHNARSYMCRSLDQ